MEVKLSVELEPADVIEFRRRIDMDLVADLITSFDPEDPHFRPTEIYNEGWLLRALLHAASRLDDQPFPLSFAPGAAWFSEALLPTAFKARYRGDPLAETRTNADGVIGHILVGEKGKADLELKPAVEQFVVVEAEIGSPLSSGIRNASYFDQAARSVACIAESLRRAARRPSDVDRLAFVVLAPQSAIDAGTFAEEMDPASIRSKVDRRISEYEGTLDEWYSRWFEPTMAEIDLLSLSWEAAISWVEDSDSATGTAVIDFYQRCLDVN
jgi:hypothetical protein